MRVFFVSIILLLSLLPTASFAQGEMPTEVVAPDETPAEKFFSGLIVEVLKDEKTSFAEGVSHYQLLNVEILSGEERGSFLEIVDEGIIGLNKYFTPKAGDEVVVGKIRIVDEDHYYIADFYRLPSMIWILAGFFGLAVILGRLRGLTSILGLGLSILVLALFIVPQILSGKSPVLITLIGASIIAVVSIFTAHGVSKKTGVAFASTILTLGIAVLLAYLFVGFSRLLGIGSEETYYLQLFPEVSGNLKGLLLSGIIIGTLGVLDDITASQTAAVAEISQADQTLGPRELYRRGLKVGREHIAALINTLALAYFGASLPLFLLFSLNSVQPLWVTLNSGLVAEEIVRTLVGSVALLLAVPITTYLAAHFLGKSKT